MAVAKNVGLPETGDRPRFWPWFGVAAAIVAADRVTKLLLLDALAPGEVRAVTGFINLVLVYNKGAAFSFLVGAPAGKRPSSPASPSSLRSSSPSCSCAMRGGGSSAPRWR